MKETTTEKKSLIETVTEQFAGQGFKGEELTKRVLAAGAILALVTKNDEAFVHFEARLNQLEALS